MANIRHVVIVRRDLNMPAGLLAAQVAHINDEFMRESITKGRDFLEIENNWMIDPYLSVLAVNTPEELQMIAKRAKEAELQVHTWEDTIYSDILKISLKVLVGISVGPDDSDKIKLVTGMLPLY